MGHFLEIVVGGFRTNDADHFHLVELMLADHAAGVAAVSTGFGTEARRMGRHLERKVLVAEHHAGDLIRQRDFSSRHEIHLFLFTKGTALLGGEEVLLELR